MSDATVLAGQDFLEPVSFYPDAARASSLDAAMRRRLAESVIYICEQAKDHIPINRDQLTVFSANLHGPKPFPVAGFALYFDLVGAISHNDLDAAQAMLERLFAFEPVNHDLRVVSLDEASLGPDLERYTRLIDDPETPINMIGPEADEAAAGRETIAAAMDLIDRYDPGHGAEIRALIHEMVLALGPRKKGALTFDGATTFTLWGSIFLNPIRNTDVLDMALSIVHESAHSLLFGFAHDGAFVENDDDERFPSPARSDPRPMDGIYHATFVMARLARAATLMLKSDVLDKAQSTSAQEQLEGFLQAYNGGIETIEAHGDLTPKGAAILDGTREAMAAL